MLNLKKWTDDEPAKQPYDKGSSEYWIGVSSNARLRKARDLATQKLKNLRNNMIYAQYVLDIAWIVREAATLAECGEAEINRFVEKCAEALQMPELLTDISELNAASLEETNQAFSQMYG